MVRCSHQPESRTRYLPESVQALTLGIPGSNANIAFILAVLIAIGLYIVLKENNIWDMNLSQLV